MSTNQKWEPLETPEAVLTAFEAGRDVEYRIPLESKWLRSYFPEFAAMNLSDGVEYRALVEGVEP